MADADIDLDEQYDSADDEDFTLDQAGDEDDAELSSSDEEAGTAEPGAKKRKKTKTGDPEDNEELDSGDEAMIRKAEKKKKKKGAEDEDDEEEGGTGGFVRTRAMKMRIQEERKPLARIDGATVDVDALWAQMNAPDSSSGLAPSQDTKKQATPGPDDVEMRDQENTEPTTTTTQEKPQTQYPEQMVKIKRTYKFAGEIITEEKVVPKDSAEAKLFLSGGQDGEVITAVEDANAETTTSKVTHLRRPLRKISRFDPNPTGAIKKSWEKQPPTEAAGRGENARGPKVNTVEKSRMDWAAYVDRAGISDELRTHSKAKEGFLGRMDFLDRVDAKKEEERRNAKFKGV
ncbi:bucentaur or craniofacial development-domain-containing protein [Aspergillus unguis]